MVFKITSEVQAEEILRALAAGRITGCSNNVVFDIVENIAHKVPLVLRRCESCDKPDEYLGWNIWAANEQASAIYCQNCGTVMKELAGVTLAICKDRVVNCGYRFPNDSV